MTQEPRKKGPHLGCQPSATKPEWQDQRQDLWRCRKSKEWRRPWEVSRKRKAPAQSLSTMRSTSMKQTSPCAMTKWCLKEVSWAWPFSRTLGSQQIPPRWWVKTTRWYSVLPSKAQAQASTTIMVRRWLRELIMKFWIQWASQWPRWLPLVSLMECLWTPQSWVLACRLQ